MTGALTHFLEERRLAQVLPRIRGAVLDLGCGYAPILKRLPRSVDYTGVDYRPEIVAYLCKTYPERNFLRCDLDRERLELPGRFDTILMIAVIEHLSHPLEMLAQLPALLKSNGQLLLTTPTNLGNQIHHYGAMLGLFSQEAADDHKMIFNRSTLAQLLDQAGFRVAAYKPFLLGQNQLCMATVKGSRG